VLCCTVGANTSGKRRRGECLQTATALTSLQDQIISYMPSRCVRTCGVPYREGCVYSTIGTPPCQVTAVYVWRSLQGGVYTGYAIHYMRASSVPEDRQSAAGGVKGQMAKVQTPLPV
jgi:hypothetical protein